MISGSKLKKLKEELHDLGITHKVIAETLGISHVYVGDLLMGRTYDRIHMTALIALRDAEKVKAKELEKTI